MIHNSGARNAEFSFANFKLFIHPDLSTCQFNPQRGLHTLEHTGFLMNLPYRRSMFRFVQSLAAAIEALQLDSI